MKKAGLDQVWPRIVAVVVQPGVEFGDTSVHEYDRQAAAHLIESLKPFSPLVFEGHSTDYQTRHHLKAMVDDGIAILKVGPALTFALREGLFALSAIEAELIDDETQRSNLRAVLEATMLAKPKNWRKHYHGNDHDVAFARKFSYSDRSRYYMFEPEVIKAIERLFENTSSIPLSLLSQAMPIQYRKVREGQLSADPKTLVSDWVNECLNDYLFACEN
jgi:D-tagatose-1,6-bisphosphate aldolase subunit GatZ/KbaZ